jgi:peptide deformylase
MELIYAPSDWLQKKVQPFDFDKTNAVETAQKMVDIMGNSRGIGLSANQVGLDAQIFVMQPTRHKELKDPFAVVNPVVQKISEETSLEYEGCLSYPNLILKISRPSKLVASFLDADAKECIIELEGYDARCFLHEYDHLQGIDFTDRVSKLKLDMAMKKKEKLEKRYTNG